MLHQGKEEKDDGTNRIGTMNADIKGALEQINKSWSSFTHRGKRMTKPQVIAVLEYGVQKGYETTADFELDEIDQIISKL